MLPFMKKRQVSGLIVEQRKPDESKQNENDSAAIESCAKDLIYAVHNRDVKAVSEALSHAFSILDSMPEQDSNNYDDLNEKAAENE